MEIVEITRNKEGDKVGLETTLFFSGGIILPNSEGKLGRHHQLRVDTVDLAYTGTGNRPIYETMVFEEGKSEKSIPLPRGGFSVRGVRKSAMLTHWELVNSYKKVYLEQQTGP